MNTEDSFLWIAGNSLAQMRLLIEGGVMLFEDEALTLLYFAAMNKQYSASLAFDTIGIALYGLHKHMCDLQAAHTKEVLREYADDQST